MRAFAFSHGACPLVFYVFPFAPLYRAPGWEDRSWCRRWGSLPCLRPRGRQKRALQKSWLWRPRHYRYWQGQLMQLRLTLSIDRRRLLQEYRCSARMIMLDCECVRLRMSAHPSSPLHTDNRSQNSEQLALFAISKSILQLKSPTAATASPR